MHHYCITHPYTHASSLPSPSSSIHLPIRPSLPQGPIRESCNPQRLTLGRGLLAISQSYGVDSYIAGEMAILVSGLCGSPVCIQPCVHGGHSGVESSTAAARQFPQRADHVPVRPAVRHVAVHAGPRGARHGLGGPCVAGQLIPPGWPEWPSGTRAVAWLDPEFRGDRDVDDPAQLFVFGEGLVVLWLGWLVERCRLATEAAEVRHSKYLGSCGWLSGQWGSTDLRLDCLRIVRGQDARCLGRVKRRWVWTRKARALEVDVLHSY